MNSITLISFVFDFKGPIQEKMLVFLNLVLFYRCLYDQFSIKILVIPSQFTRFDLVKHFSIYQQFEIYLNHLHKTINLKANFSNIFSKIFTIISCFFLFYFWYFSTILFIISSLYLRISFFQSFLLQFEQLDYHDFLY